jgi:ribosomal protein S18 acetylase RimI-like enzyme
MIRKSKPQDGAAILALYQSVAAVAGGIARAPHELSAGYIAGFSAPLAIGAIQFVFDEGGAILGEIHAAPGTIACFAHVMGDLTIAVAPAGQGRGIGRALFQALLAEVTQSMPHISRVELFVRESNLRAQQLYQSLGFVHEGRLRRRVLGASGQPEDDLVMGWLRPQSGND